MVIYLRDTEAATWNGGVTILREIPDDLQPRIVDGLWQIEARQGMVFKGPTLDPCSIFRTNAREYFNEPLASVCPFLPGQSVDCKETWWFADMIGKHLYKADARDDGNLFHHGILMRPDRWHSPVTMPRAAVRRHGVIESVNVVENDGWWWEIKVKEKRCP